jgi:glyoxylase-like metal-dependent hydrolase (beta-lactamase superfamily II)
MEQGLPPSPHFELEKLADGVYAAIARDAGAAGGNAGIINLGDQTMVFDTFLTPRAATDLRVAAEFLAERQVAFVINSHWHNAHIRGNQVFTPETEILSTRSTLQFIRTESPG